MLALIKEYKLHSLLILAMICGAIWRIEVEYYGWKGLIWLSYFHWAIPIGFALFLLWTNSFFELTIVNRVLINLVAILFGILSYVGLETSLTYVFNRGPSAFIMEMQTPKWKLHLYRYSAFILICVLPIGTYFILRVFKIKRSWKFLLLGVLGTIISIPISVALLELFNHKGGQDYIHSIKSGFIIPLWVVSIGSIIIGKNEPVTMVNKKLSRATQNSGLLILLLIIAMRLVVITRNIIKTSTSFTLIALLLSCTSPKNMQAMQQNAKINFTNVTGLISNVEFEKIIEFVLKNGDKLTYRSFDSNNPHYQFKFCDIFLGSDIGQGNVNNDPKLSKFNQLTIRIQDSAIIYLDLILVRKGDLKEGKAWVLEGMDEGQVYLVDTYNVGLIILKNQLSNHLKEIRKEIDRYH